MDWSRILQAAGIPAVGAQVACVMPLDFILRFYDLRDGDEAHWQRMVEARASIKSDEMMRWDCCASLDIKQVMADVAFLRATAT